VVTYVAGALTELGRIPENRELFYESGGVQALLKYQMSTDPELIVNINNAIATYALHPPSLALVLSLSPFTFKFHDCRCQQLVTVTSHCHISL